MFPMTLLMIMASWASTGGDRVRVIKLTFTTVSCSSASAAISYAAKSWYQNGPASCKPKQAVSGYVNWYKEERTNPPLPRRAAYMSKKEAYRPLEEQYEGHTAGPNKYTIPSSSTAPESKTTTPTEPIKPPTPIPATQPSTVPTTANTTTMPEPMWTETFLEHRAWWTYIITEAALITTLTIMAYLAGFINGKYRDDYMRTRTRR